MNDPIRMSLIFLGSTGAGPIYSMEMALSIYKSTKCKLQIIISEKVLNLQKWKFLFENKDNVELNIVPTYNHTKIDAIKGLLNINKIKRVEKLVKEYRPEIIYYPFDVVWGWYLFRTFKGFAKQIYTLHDPHPHDPNNNLLQSLYNRLLFNSLNYVDSFILLNHKDVSYVKKLYNKPIVVIQHASFNEYDIKPVFNVKLTKTIGFFGRIEPYKGLDILVRAFVKINNPSLKLMIAGSGSIERDIMSLIKNDNRIELINRYISEEELPNLIKNTDFIVLPYKTATQSGVIPLVFAFGKTVIATNVGALSEQVPYNTGLLVEPTIEAINTSIEFLYNNPQKIIDLGKNAYEYAQKELTWESSTKTLLSFLNKQYYQKN